MMLVPIIIGATIGWTIGLGLDFLWNYINNKYDI